MKKGEEYLLLAYSILVTLRPLWRDIKLLHQIDKELPVDTGPINKTY